VPFVQQGNREIKREKFQKVVAIADVIGYNTSAWVFTCEYQNHTPGDRAPKCPFSGGQRGMIGVEETTKGEMKKWLSYL